jgi:8-oxo-dGTP diphosphatase
MAAKEQGANQTTGRWMMVARTLCFIVNGDDVLLMKRAASKKIFPNRYNGVGGHIERDEDPLTSARREILEETGLKIRQLHLRAVYNIDANEDTGIVLFVFVGQSDSRKVRDTEEGSLHWIPQSAVLQFDLVDDLPIILPRVLAMKPEDAPLFVHVGYDADDCLQMRFASDML